MGLCRPDRHRSKKYRVPVQLPLIRRFLATTHRRPGTCRSLSPSYFGRSSNGAARAAATESFWQPRRWTIDTSSESVGGAGGSTLMKVFCLAAKIKRFHDSYIVYIRFLRVD